VIGVVRAECGTTMPASHDDYFSCSCGSMHLDVGYGRFGSRRGDQNILVDRSTLRR
jgi:hypothetical protein